MYCRQMERTCSDRHVGILVYFHTNMFVRLRVARRDDSLAIRIHLKRTVSHVLHQVPTNYTPFSVLCFVDRTSRYICVMKTNLMHYLSSVFFVNQPLDVSGIFVAHHQDVHCIYTTHNNCCVYTVYLLMMGYKCARNM